MRVLVGCEFSGTVRDAFIRRGHDAVSCDLLPSEVGGPHIQGDLTYALYFFPDKWDLLICHPPCTHLASSGAKHFRWKEKEQKAALEFVRMLLAAPVPHICLENPVSIIATRIRPPDQTIEPWMFGHGETKKTCLWLKGLPHLRATTRVKGRYPATSLVSQSDDRWKIRSRTYFGVAEAMAEQWGG